ncbi:hypothetical protein U8527_08755 [Kordia algicida OT-1]|uniref:Uncharacterized protein n=1 Tax=Kordia algicida OT-1 TaxID=391587 RepID=A9CUE3_9FLAO|nr:hypothetical protein [Kordia algicida]EDP94119.1 hypothetical protein KAOT1_02196 [Kordia algicida OT-1]
MKKIIYIILLTITYSSCLTAQEAHELITNLEKADTFYNFPSNNIYLQYSVSDSLANDRTLLKQLRKKEDPHHDFELLKSKATTQELLELTKSSNKIVASYAGWGLIDREYKDILKIFNYFLNSDDEVYSATGCLRRNRYVYSILYTKYRQQILSGVGTTDFKRSKEILLNDTLLFKMDSLVVFKKDSDNLILREALYNRVYSSNFLPRIKQLAFNDLNIDAVKYIFKNHLQGNEKSIQATLIRYVEEGRNKYYRNEVIRTMLLSFKNEKINQFVLEKLPKTKKNPYLIRDKL